VPSHTFDNTYSQVFTSSGTWTCPQDVHTVIVEGCGAGKNGGAAISGSGGDGGAGSLILSQTLTVIPGTAYTITIGTSGSEAASSFGALLTFPCGTGAAGGGGGGFAVPGGYQNGSVGQSTDYASRGSGGAGTFTGTFGGGGGGGGASLGAGGNGGGGSSVVAATAGGVGAGGGGAGGNGSDPGAANGGRGQITIWWNSVKR
jgi:hypothetical protein